MLLWLLACRGFYDPLTETGVDVDPVEPLPLQAEVELAVLDLVDTSRGHDAFADLPASSVRPLPTWVWLPAGEGVSIESQPVLIMAHGNSGHPSSFEPFARGLAERGVLVVAPIFPVTNRDGDSGGLGIPDFVNQPDDLDFVWAELERLDADPASPVHRRLDLDRVVAAGHSLGGATVAGWTRYGDAPRTDMLGTVLVSAAIFLDAPFGEGPHVEGPPVQLLHGAMDPLVPPSNSEGFFEDVGPPVGWVVMPTAQHSDLIEGSGPLVPQTIDLVEAVFRAWTSPDAGRWPAALDASEALGNGVQDKGVR